jgi:hypothetical protein
MKPPGEYPPDRAAELTSTIEDAFDICLEIPAIPAISGTEPNEDLRLSERFCSSCNSLIARSIDEVMLNRSAVRSKCSILPTYAPCNTCKSGVGCLKAGFRPDAVRTMGEVVFDGWGFVKSAAVAGRGRTRGSGREMLTGGNGARACGDEDPLAGAEAGIFSNEKAGELGASSAKSSFSTMS